MTPFDGGGTFRPLSEGRELRRLAVRGAAATVSAQGLGLAVQLMSTVVVARLLTPADFGVVTMVATFSLLLEGFGLNGFTEAIIQCKELDRHTASNLFWLNLGAGLIFALMFAAARSLSARFYQNPPVANVAVAMSPILLIAAGSVIHLALLKRAMGFPSSI